MMKHALSAVTEGSSTTVLHIFSLWFTQSGPLILCFLSMCLDTFQWVSSLLNDATKTQGGEDKKGGGQEGRS